MATETMVEQEIQTDMSMFKCVDVGSMAEPSVSEVEVDARPEIVELSVRFHSLLALNKKLLDSNRAQHSVSVYSN
jgi:hypothetical protein